MSEATSAVAQAVGEPKLDDIMSETLVNLACEYTGTRENDYHSQLSIAGQMVIIALLLRRGHIPADRRQVTLERVKISQQAVRRRRPLSDHYGIVPELGALISKLESPAAPNQP